MTATPAPPERDPDRHREVRSHRTWRWGLIFSAVVHLCLLSVLIYVPYTWWVSYQKLLAGGGASETAAEEEQDAAKRDDPAASKEDAPRAKPEPVPPEALTNHAELLPAGRVGDKLREYVAGVDRLSPQKKKEKLNELATQLKDVSSPAAVDEMTTKFSQWMDVKPREKAPEGAAPQGEFDFHTAQVDDVRRKRNEAGKWEYTSVLVDAKGRKMETPIDATTGEELYSTFELIRTNPLVGQVYRQMVMPLLDKAMQSAQQGASPKKAVESVVPKP